MRLAANKATSTVACQTADDASQQLLGLMIVSLFPALFWTALIAGTGAAAGHTFGPEALVSFGTAVAAFLAAVGQALFSRA
jgi:hypothetical protein